MADRGVVGQVGEPDLSSGRSEGIGGEVNSALWHQRPLQPVNFIGHEYAGGESFLLKTFKSARPS